MTAGSSIFAFLAGLVSVLSPCVLPLLPAILGTATSEHRFGPVALAAGLALSFVSIGLFIATVGFSIGFDAALLRTLAAVLMIGLGIALIVPHVSAGVATAVGPLSSWADETFSGFDTSGLKGQFLLGLLLGAIWSPCVGPTLGAASVLAAQGRDIAQVAIVMLMFGLGAALPLLLLGLLSRETMLRMRARLSNAGRGGKFALGGLLIVTGLFIVSGLDKKVEAALVAASPAWLTELTTAF